MILALIRRDALRGLRAAGLPVAFFLIAATHLPLPLDEARSLSFPRAGGGPDAASELGPRLRGGTA